MFNNCYVPPALYCPIAVWSRWGRSKIYTFYFSIKNGTTKIDRNSYYKYFAQLISTHTMDNFNNRNNKCHIYVFTCLKLVGMPNKVITTTTTSNSISFNLLLHSGPILTIRWFNYYLVSYTCAYLENAPHLSYDTPLLVFRLTFYKNWSITNFILQLTKLKCFTVKVDFLFRHKKYGLRFTKWKSYSRRNPLVYIRMCSIMKIKSGKWHSYLMEGMEMGRGKKREK